jgi:hypothetical protein
MKRSIIPKKAIISSAFFALMFTDSSFKYKFNSIESIQFTDVKISCSSVHYLNPIYIIRNNAELNTVLEGINKQAQATCSLSKIDFEKFTLIGSSALGHGSETPTISKKVSLDAATKKLYYDVDIYEQGQISSREHIVNYWILIPKIEKEIDVISNIHHHTLSEKN